MIEFLSNSIDETKSFGEKFAGQVEKGATILLSGDLGAGKQNIRKHRSHHSAAWHDHCSNWL